MEPRSELAELYFALYGQMPTSHSVSELLRLERFFQLSGNDPVAHMLVIMLRGADRMQEEASRRTRDEERFMDELKSLTGSLTYLTGTMDRVRRTIGGRAARMAYSMSDEQIVPTNRSASPLLGYLRYAFYRRQGPLDDDERIVAARWDLLVVVPVLAMMFLVGAFAFKLRVGP